MADDYKTRYNGPTKEAERVVEVQPRSLFREKMVRVGIVGSGGIYCFFGESQSWDHSHSSSFVLGGSVRLLQVLPSEAV